MSNIITYTESFGLKLEEVTKKMVLEPYPKQLIKWFHSFVLNDLVPAYASLHKFIVTGDAGHLLLLDALYNSTQGWSQNK